MIFSAGKLLIDLKKDIYASKRKLAVSAIVVLGASLIFPYAELDGVVGLLSGYYLFFTAIFFLFFLPGFYLNSLIKAKNNLSENIFLSCVFGILFSTLIFFTFSILRLDVFSIVALGVVDILAIRKIMFKGVQVNIKKLTPYILLFIMALTFSLTMLTSGYTSEGLRLLGVNNYDGLWYLALINEMKFNFPPQHPGFSGEMLVGYHFFLFFIMAKIGSIFNLSNINLMFKFFPLLVSFLWALGVYSLMLSWSKSKTVSVFAVFLTMFGGSAVYVTWLYGYKNISLDSGYGILQPATSLVNPTFAISIVFMTAFLLSVKKYYNEKNIRWFFVITLIAGLTPIFKVYGGIIIMGGFILFSIFEIYKKNLKIVMFIIGTAVLFFSTYWPYTDNSVKPVFYPLWAPHNVLKDNLPWYGYEEKIRTYSEQSVIKGIITTELFALYVFIFGNLGTRIVGLLFGLGKVLKEKRLPSRFALLVWSMTGASFLIPLFFIQSGKVFETIQFAWYFLFLISLISALGVAFFLSFRINKVIKTAVVVLLVMFTLPSSVSSISDYVFSSEGFMDKSIYDSYSYLREKGEYDDTVLSLPSKNSELSHAALKRKYRAGRPVVPAIADKRSFLSYEYFPFDVNVDERIDLLYKMLFLERIIDAGSAQEVLDLQMEIKNRLELYDISYIHSPDTLKLVSLFDNIKEVYKNTGVVIYEVE